MAGTVRLRRAGAMAALLLTGAGASGPASPAAGDGSTALPATTVPLSGFITPRARDVIVTRAAWALSGFTNPSGDPDAEVSSPALKASCARESRRMIARLDRQYPATIQHVTIAGVPADIVTPASGIAEANANRVLINMHGGGFVGKCPDGLVEAMPIASTGRIKVITIDYREAPEAKFPAASEDVAAVFRALLKTYPARNIGLYGCSAGGTLAGQATAWIIAHGLPKPGAIGVFCAGMTIGITGDSDVTTRFTTITPTKGLAPLFTYMADADPKDPMVSPALDLRLLAKFPPVLLVTATRDAAMSSALFSHNQLAKAGVESDLRVWEGLWHSFLFDDLPEARDANAIITRFFATHLGSRSLGQDRRVR